ncbi:MAG TPA: SpoIIE family protein phosphatase [Propionicimonas sp.]|uniref:SpoIIE family protein phosphatase n=1 Tax=Propionicimonas sp. TaxID=1955623 RepID=UPI002F3E801E
MTAITSVKVERRAKRPSARVRPSRPDRSRRRALWPPSGRTVMACAILIGICALGWFSVVTRPADALAAVWWPASGLAIGLGIRSPRRYLWLASLAVAVVLVGANLAQYGSVPLAIASSIGAGAELAIGTLILRSGMLRSGGAETPALATPRDLAILLLAAVAAATAYDATIALTTLATGDGSAALQHLFSAGPRRAAGIMLVAPLFMRLPALRRDPKPVTTAIRIGVALTVTWLVFGANGYLPLAFLVIVPPVWSALSISPRWLMIEMLCIASIASYGSATGHGPFSFSRFGATTGGTLLQAFELTMVIIVLLISLTVLRERRSAARLSASELVYRRNFETSLAGQLVVVNAHPTWQVQHHNTAAAALFPQLNSGVWELADLLGSEASDVIVAVTAEKPARRSGFEVEATDGRHFQVSLAALGVDSDKDTFAIQLLDITDSLRAQRQDAEELERASEVQRALSPAELPSRPGWKHGAAAVSARQVGGDFYDLRIAGRLAVMTLGDVMGKGVGAGILAAATRTALRAANPETRPADVLADSVRIVEDDLSRNGAFVTIGYAVIDLLSGEVRLADAGHGLTFVVRQHGPVVERLATLDLPLGLGTDWTELRALLNPGDSLLMVSDGVLDRWGGSIEQLMDAIGALRSDPSIESPQHLVDTLCRAEQDEAIPGDDATAVIFHREGSRS